MKIERFEDIIAWQKSRLLAKHIYDSMKNSKDYDFRSQITRAGVSIMNNIAEGFERRGDKELKHFLFIAKGSCGEVRSMLYLGQELNYLSENTFTTCYKLSLEISRLLSGFITSLK